MKKYLLGIALFILVTPTVPARQGYCETQTPEQLVRDFYAWYFEADKGPVAAENKDEIYKYVAPETVEAIRKRYPPANVSYFARANTFNAIWTNPKVIVAESISMAEDVFVIPVTFELNYKFRDKIWRDTYHVIVFVKKEHDAFYIIKVDDIYPYS